MLIGTSAVGLLDSKTTPIDPVMPGVEVHAQVLESVLDPLGACRLRTMRSEPNCWRRSWSALIIIWLAPIFNPAMLLVFGAAIIALSVGASWYFYVHDQLLIDFTYPLLSSVLVYLTLMFSNYMSEQAQRRQIRSAFGQYLSPTLVEQLAQSPEKLVLGGEQRNMTIMFSDVRGFTTISELFKDDPQGLTSLMNRFLTPLDQRHHRSQGHDRQIHGRCDHGVLERATRRRRARNQRLRRRPRHAGPRRAAQPRTREQEAKAKGTRFISLQVGVGLNTGPCVVGNMGSDLRFDYSVLGDSVNLASRLEGQTKTYGVPIIVGSTHRARRERQIRIARGRFHHRQRQDRAGGHLHASRP